MSKDEDQRSRAVVVEAIPVTRHEEPTEPGWYAYSGGAQNMIFLRHRDWLAGEPCWSVVFDNGTISRCAWGYIEQALAVWDLVPLVPDTMPKPDAEGVWHVRSCREGAAGHNGCFDVVSGLPYAEVKEKED